MVEDTYKIVRCFQRGYGRETIETGLTFEEAREHCADPNTSSKTATGSAEVALTHERGPWFDAYYVED
jgi:hypothetical protein